MATKGYDLDDAPVSGAREKAPRVEELVDLMELGDRYATVRIASPLFAYGIHWVKTKRKDGSLTSFPIACSAFDSDTGQRDSTKKCPWCDHMSEHPEPKDMNARKGFIGVSFAVDYYVNVISRALQKKITEPETPTKEEQKTGFKSKESDTPTIFRVLRLTAGVIRAIKGLKDLNVREVDGESQAYAVSHPKYGADISLKYDKDAAGAAKYPVQMGAPSIIKKSEKAFLPWDISNLVTTPSLEVQKSEYAAWAERMGFKKKGKKKEDIEEDDEDVGLDDEDDEDEPKPKKKTAVKTKSKYDDEDEDEDDAPPAKSKKKVVEEDDEDDDEDKPVAKKKPAAKKKVVEEEEEDDDEEPVVKKKPEAKANKKKAVVEDDDEDDSPFKDDEDEDEPKPKAKKPAKKKPADDEDDDDVYG